MKYNYARTIETREGKETFTAVECASFDEAIKYVEKGIYDRKLQLHEKYAVPLPVAHMGLGGNLSPTTPQTTTGSQNMLHNGSNAASTTTPGSQTPPNVSDSITRS